MSIFDDWSRMAKENRAKYPPGTRIMLLSMDDPHHPVPPGTRGTVEHVDDGGNIHMKWDNGRSLGICTEVDSIRTLTAAELAEEQAEKESHRGQRSRRGRSSRHEYVGGQSIGIRNLYPAAPSGCPSRRSG